MKRTILTRGGEMSYFLDTEFIERPSTIELISIGLAAEDGRELYLENVERNRLVARSRESSKA